MSLRPVLVLLMGSMTAIGVASARQDEQPTWEELREQARPGPEHERLGALAGEWEVIMHELQHGQEVLGEGVASTILDGRFLVLDFSLAEGYAEFRYTLGFDRRHDEYSLVVMDTTGTYFVTGRGPEADGRILMRGTDDDPMMASLGYEKKFAFELAIEDEDAFSITTHFVDTRTDEEPLIPNSKVQFLRK